MKSVKRFYFLFVCTSGVVCAKHLPLELRNAQAIEAEYCNVIHDIFTQARESLAAKEDIITLEWLAREDIKEIQHLMSDVCIVFNFDRNDKNVMSEKLQVCLQTKIRDEVKKIFESNEVSVEGVEQFFYLSKIMCDLSQGTDCRGMMLAIKNENFDSMKKQKKVQRQLKREKMRRVSERVILGAHPRR